jgi:hypothetical protein
MADRRGFLKRLMGSLSLAVVAPSIPVKAAPVEEALVELKRFTVGAPDRFIYRRFLIRWTGWKSLYGNDCLVAQWLANEKDGRNFYASFPGSEGMYYAGQVFDISTKSWQRIVTLSTSEEDKHHFRLLCLQRIIGLVDGSVGRADQGAGLWFPSHEFESRTLPQA